MSYPLLCMIAQRQRARRLRLLLPGTKDRYPLCGHERWNGGGERVALSHFPEDRGDRKQARVPVTCVLFGLTKPFPDISEPVEKAQRGRPGRRE